MFTVAVKVTTTATDVDADVGADGWWLTSVHGPQADDEKVLFLEELQAIRDECDGLCLFGLSRAISI